MTAHLLFIRMEAEVCLTLVLELSFEGRPGWC